MNGHTNTESVKQWLAQVIEGKRYLQVLNGAIGEVDDCIDDVDNVPAVTVSLIDFDKKGEILVKALGIAALVAYISYVMLSSAPVIGALFRLVPVEIHFLVCFFLAWRVYKAIVNENAEEVQKAQDARNALIAERRAGVPALQKQRGELLAVRDKVNELLNSLFRQAPIASDYWGIVPLTAMYGYLATGRCLEVFGQGGIIDTFEKDKYRWAMLGELQAVNVKLDRIDNRIGQIVNNQKALKEYVDRGSAELRRLSDSIRGSLSSQEAANARMIACQEYTNKCATWVAGAEVYRSLAK